MTLTHAADTADHLVRMGSVGIPELHSRIVWRHQPVVVADIGEVVLQQADTRSVGAVDLPFAVASCEADRTGQAGLAPGRHLDRSAQLLVAGARLPASFGFRPPSFWPSTLCESL